MDEYIDKEKAVCLVEAAASKADALAALKQMPPVPQWISCKTRKPEKSGLYLVTKQQKTGEIQIATAHYNTAFDEWSGNGNFKKVLAWQPLPSPWKGEQDNGAD